MPSAFDALWGGVQPIFDAHWGENICLVPQVKDDASEYVEVGTDASRPVREIVGIVTLATVVDRTMGGGVNNRDNADLMASKTTIDFDDAVFVPGSQPQDGDLLLLLDRPQVPSFKVVSCEHDNAARWVCVVVFDRNTAS